MDRRNWLKRTSVGAGTLGLPWLAGALAAAQETSGPASAADGKNLPPLKITDIKTILTAPADIRLVVVKVVTSEPGLYGLAVHLHPAAARR